MASDQVEGIKLKGIPSIGIVEGEILSPVCQDLMEMVTGVKDEVFVHNIQISEDEKDSSELEAITTDDLSVVILIDISGSMEPRMELLRAALLKIAEEAHSKGVELNFVEYHSDIKTFVCQDLELTKRHIHDLETKGGTNYEKAYEEAKSVLTTLQKKNIVIWQITDGEPWEGKKTAEELLPIIESLIKSKELSQVSFNCVSIAVEKIDALQMLKSLSKEQLIELNDASRIEQALTLLFGQVSKPIYAFDGQLECKQSALTPSATRWICKKKLYIPYFDRALFANHIFLAPSKDKYEIQVSYVMAGQTTRTCSDVFPVRMVKESEMGKHAMLGFVLTHMAALKVECPSEFSQLAPKVLSYLNEHTDDFPNSISYVVNLQDLLRGKKIDQAQISNEARGVNLFSDATSDRTSATTNDTKTDDSDHPKGDHPSCGRFQVTGDTDPCCVVSTARNHFLPACVGWALTFDQDTTPIEAWSPSNRELKMFKTKRSSMTVVDYAGKTSQFHPFSMAAYELGLKKYIRRREWKRVFVTFSIYQQLLREGFHGPERKDDYHLLYLAMATHESRKLGDYGSSKILLDEIAREIQTMAKVDPPDLPTDLPTVEKSQPPSPPPPSTVTPQKEEAQPLPSASLAQTLAEYQKRNHFNYVQ